ncbi:MAG: RagB/SusD family nutrient uptake outer membrane protein, partial [Tannerellaceae bacterium]
MKKTIYSILSLIALLSTSCNYLDVDPVGQVIPEKASEFRALMTAGYRNFPDSYKSSVTIRTDELDLCSEYSWSYETWFDLAIWNDLAGNPKLTELSYDTFYKTIFYANHTIAEESKIQDDDTESIPQIVAEAYAMRAFAHFELVNMYAQPYNNETLDSKAIPLSVVIDTEQAFPRATLREVYAQIWSDINSAEERMEIASQPENYRYRFSKESMLAFQARVSLYQQDWQKAYDYATELIALRPELQDLNAEGALPPYNYKSVEAVQSLKNFINMDVRDDFPVSEKLLGL